jgi:hypothetical protein
MTSFEHPNPIEKSINSPTVPDVPGMAPVYLMKEGVENNIFHNSQVSSTLPKDLPEAATILAQAKMLRVIPGFNDPSGMMRTTADGWGCSLEFKEQGAVILGTPQPPFYVPLLKE